MFWSGVGVNEAYDALRSSFRLIRCCYQSALYVEIWRWGKAAIECQRSASRGFDGPL